MERGREGGKEGKEGKEKRRKEGGKGGREEETNLIGAICTFLVPC